MAQTSANGLCGAALRWIILNTCIRPVQLARGLSAVYAAAMPAVLVRLYRGRRMLGRRRPEGIEI